MLQAVSLPSTKYMSKVVENNYFVSVQFSELGSGTSGLKMDRF